MSRGPWHVAVLMGGWSAEREVSLMSGNGVADALESRGHKVTRIDMDRDVALRLTEATPDVVFNALHGVPGDDGTVQGLLDLMGLKYTHSGLVTSVIASDISCASATTCAAEMNPYASWIRCRNSIRRSRRRGASPRSARTSASALGSTWRPFGRPRSLPRRRRFEVSMTALFIGRLFASCCLPAWCEAP